MSILQSIILGIVQGLTEFLPISSSAHLVLVPWWLGWPEPSLAFDTLLHWGTLLAVITFFWRDWVDMVVALFNRVRGRRDPDGRDRLLLLIVVATIPAAVAGFLLKDFFESVFGSPGMVGFFLIITGFMLMAAERWWSHGHKPLLGVTFIDAVVIGLVQAVAILPGISRSGSTMSAGMMRGFNRPTAARFSFLMSAPIIFGAGVTQLPDMIKQGGSGNGLALILGFLAAAIVGFLAIRFLLRYLQTNTFYPFVIYVWIVGGATVIRALLLR
jgi:undecaprenyl-diphosphatase